ncbi:hypothetical protein P8C59_000327 [Phyllachora maydis]|uniref:DNA repair protein RAD16 n=1 Tax=Phyllachora maydis TaxID=1825666 RepID=A0AAD9HXF0_9PEZI|nr:hypothetical protein P8C59_000327 [Phyllachora maydis]
MFTTPIYEALQDLQTVSSEFNISRGERLSPSFSQRILCRGKFGIPAKIYKRLLIWKRQSKFRSRIEVRIPAVAADQAPPNSYRQLRRSIYALAPKRKRNDLDDSDDEDYPDTSRDAVIARQLQDDVDRQAKKDDASSLAASVYKRQKASSRKAVGAKPSKGSTWKRRSTSAITQDDDDDSHGSGALAGYSSDASTSVAPSSASMSPAMSLHSSDASDDDEENEDDSDNVPLHLSAAVRQAAQQRRAFRSYRSKTRVRRDRARLEELHPELKTMWDDLKNMPVLKAGKAAQPRTISRLLKPFQLEGLAWMKEMEKTKWQGGLLGDEMGLGKTIQAVSLIMSDFPQPLPTLVLVPPVALMQWMTEIESYTDGTLKTLVLHGTNAKSKYLTAKELKTYNVIIMSYNSLESIYRKQEKGFKRKEGLYKEQSVVHHTKFHRVILDEAHSIKTRSTMTAKACFALQCKCSSMEWKMNDSNVCTGCKHNAMQHVSVFNQELLNPIQKYGNAGMGAEAFKKLRVLTDRIMLRRLKKDHTNSMELPVKEIYVDRQFFGEAESDFATSIMTSGQRKFDTYVASGVMLNNYANIFGLIMQMRQVADHPDLILKKSAEGGQNVLSYLNSLDDLSQATTGKDNAQPQCPVCHIPLSIDLEQPEIEQEENMVKKSSIINRIKMENWTSSSKIELLVHELHRLRSDNATHKSIIFSQFTTMLQLLEWRLRRAGITTVMLDGSMTPAQRQASIEHFMKNVQVECFLVSLKAGGVALNLTEASRVFIVDPWWNPAAEWQSADRCHRIGQTRPCTITRLCIEDSVESRMVLLQEKKTNMINSTINSDDAAMDSLSPEDLQFLFRGS